MVDLTNAHLKTVPDVIAPNLSVLFGLQDEPIATTRIWVLPNPSGLNANYRPAELVELYADLQAAARGE